MTFLYDDRVKVTATNPGTAAFPYNAVAVTGFNPFTAMKNPFTGAAITNGDKLPYWAYDGTTGWETGFLTYNTSTGMARGVKRNSLGTTVAINFTGPVTIACDGIAPSTLQLDSDGALAVAPYGVCSVVLANDQSIGNNQYAKINFDTVLYDPNSLWDATNHRVVIAKAGHYRISGGFAGNGPSGTIAIASISKNGISGGAGTILAQDVVSGVAAASTNMGVSISPFILALAVADTIELDGYVASASSGTAAGAGLPCRLLVEWVGP